MDDNKETRDASVLCKKDHFPHPAYLICRKVYSISLVSSKLFCADSKAKRVLILCVKDTYVINHAEYLRA